jgi:hypothetical protein
MVLYIEYTIYKSYISLIYIYIILIDIKWDYINQEKKREKKTVKTRK